MNKIRCFHYIFLFIFCVFNSIEAADLIEEHKSYHLLKSIENDRNLMQRIAFHILNDPRSKKRVQDKFKEHSQEQYIKWKSAIENGESTHITKKHKFYAFNEEIAPKNIETIKNLLGDCQLIFRMTDEKPDFVIEMNYRKKIASAFVKSGERMTKEDIEEPSVLVMFLNIDKIISYISQHGLADYGWEKLGGLIITMYPTTEDFLNSTRPRIQ